MSIGFESSYPSSSTRRSHTADEIYAAERRGLKGGSPANVADGERWLSVAGGAALGLLGLSRGSLGGLALAALGGGLVYRGLTARCPLYGALGISTAEPSGPRASVAAQAGVKVQEAITVARSAEELFRYWRNLENLPRIMSHLDSVKMIDARRSHWIAKGPLDRMVEWDAEIINEQPHELIAWRSLEGSDVDTAGSVHFRQAPGGRGTEILVSLKYDPPAGRLGAAIARLFGKAPEQQIHEDLRRFKQMMETGELPTTAGQPRGACAGR